MELDDEQLERLRLGAITAIDGLWFLAAEERLGFEAAFELDLEVWKRYGLVLLKRLARELEITLSEEDPPDLQTVNLLMEQLCRIDGTTCAWEMTGPAEARFDVLRCPWWENLRRSSREDVVDCEFVDNIIFLHWLDSVNPAVRMEITRSLPRGDDHCSWRLWTEKAAD
ncbi:MAG: DUF6125 family protein [Actinomycetota bacterium]